ncbi:hypothetical protein OGAPHI_004123 [Ogataea philodendri]|uniref:Uncharacterized protein n=1 Tax=Ogataea philodendri TaxID=1378263 RepID=A0A9P8P6N9_9ASCO|nr:uncharacterized protein OGAPHI_004123 [Ogataea philodendri]KAH3665934.1 hypothetical protein OGAPHI_004123 [Ogataea philodendri]
MLQQSMCNVVDRAIFVLVKTNKKQTPHKPSKNRNQPRDQRYLGDRVHLDNVAFGVDDHNEDSKHHQTQRVRGVIQSSREPIDIPQTET